MSNRPKQSHLTKKERLADENPFIIDTELDLNGKEILLVDDIYTTGLTIHRAGVNYMLKISENSKCLRLHDKMLKYNKELPIKRFKEITMIRFEIHGDNLTIDAIYEEKKVSWNVILMTYKCSGMLKLKLIQIQLLKL